MECARWCKQLEQKLGRTRNADGVCAADLDILDPETIHEPFFQPLVREIQVTLSGRNSDGCEARTIPLQVAGTAIGLAPCRLSQPEFA